MNFNLEWLKEHLETTKTAEEICKKLNEIGLEVEKEVPSYKIFEKVVVAEIKECENHPDSDHLHVCKVFDGKETYQIVCGAPNARTGIKVALALVGAYLPNGDFKIKKSKIRGIDSCGMMCSEREMGIGNDHEGIMELPDECKLGELWFKEYKADEKMPIEISITPNRGDATSVYGIARDLNACDFGKLKNIENASVSETIKNTFSVNVKIDNCKYLCREIRNINTNIKTPKYILKRNALNGCSDNGVIVNILNYLMFTYGQPMHSYDADRIGKNITIDYAKKDTFKTLKGEEIKYNKDKILTVQDENNDLCIAGIIGGDDCKTTNETKNILLECAYFPTTPITIGGQELKIVSDARFRYERGINPEITDKILNLATKMIIELCGGEASNIVENGQLNEHKIIKYNLSTTKKLLGCEISKDRTLEILKKLNFEILDENNDFINVKVPLFRHDIENEADITEELARIEGYDKIPEVNYEIKKFSKNLFEEKIYAKKYLSGKGMIETISFAFCDKNKASLFSDVKEELELLNPISSDLNYMRPTLLISLLQAVKTNESNILENQLSFFEEGMIFDGLSKENQQNSIAGVYCGNAIKNNHLKECRQFDIFDAKKDLFELLERVYQVNTKSVKIEKSTKKYIHPTRSFDLKIRDKNGEKIIATFGEISPIILKDFEIKNNVCFFEVFVDELPETKEKNKQFIENNIQPVVRDIAFIVNQEVTAGEIMNSYKNDLLVNIEIVDVFNLSLLNKKSVALRYTFQPRENITIEEINKLMNDIILAVKNKTGGEVRDGKNQ